MQMHPSSGCAACAEERVRRVRWFGRYVLWYVDDTSHYHLHASSHNPVLPKGAQFGLVFRVGGFSRKARFLSGTMPVEVSRWTITADRTGEHLTIVDGKRTFTAPILEVIKFLLLDLTFSEAFWQAFHYDRLVRNVCVMQVCTERGSPLDLGPPTPRDRVIRHWLEQVFKEIPNRVMDRVKPWVDGRVVAIVTAYRAQQSHETRRRVSEPEVIDN